MATDPFEIEALLGAYALDAVDLHEARIVEEYLLANPRARAEVQERDLGRGGVERARDRIADLNQPGRERIVNRIVNRRLVIGRREPL